MYDTAEFLAAEIAYRTQRARDQWQPVRRRNRWSRPAVTPR